MGLGVRVRKLALARGVSAGQPSGPAGLCWTGTVFEVDAASLVPGDRVIADVVVVRRCEPGDVVDEALRVERVTRDPEELGVVFAWDGREIGVVKPGRRGGAVYDYAWPVDLARSAG